MTLGLEGLTADHIKEAIKTQPVQLTWESIHGQHTPCAVIPLHHFSNNLHGITFTLVDSEKTLQMLAPLVKTWHSQFDPQNSDKWFDGQLLIQHYSNSPSVINGLPCAGEPNNPSKKFCMSVVISSEEGEQVVASLVASWDLITSPEKVYLSALAVLPDMRKLGLGEKLIQYATLMFNRYHIGMRMECDTNVLGEQVSGGWSPVPAWQAWGFEEFGRLPNYGTNNESVGDAIYLGANTKALSEKILTQRTWNQWGEQLPPIS